MKLFTDINLIEAVKSSGLRSTIKTKVLPEIMMTSSKQRKITVNCLLKRYKSKLKLSN